MKARTRLIYVCVIIVLLGGYSLFSLFSRDFSSFVSPYFRGNSGGVLFVGDVMLARSVESQIEKVGEKRFFDNVLPLHKTAEFVVGNFEASIPLTHARTPDFAFQFSVDAALLPLLTNAGFTHMTLANNHANDFGPDARTNTAVLLQKNNITPFGNPDGASDVSVTYLKENGRIIALIGLQTVTKAPSYADISALMKTVRSKSDIQIPVVHWGTEYSRTHTAEQEAFATFLVQEGADAIIGHHPHVVEDIGSIQGVPVFYSLGNYVFDQYFDNTVQTGLAVRFSVTDKALTFHLIPVRTERSVPYVMQDGEADTFLRDLSLRSNERFSMGVSKGMFSVGY